MKFQVFISSVQSEFASARRQLAAMIRKDRWLSMFFDVFLFEETDAQSKSVQQVYLDAVADSDIYLGLVGNEYGNEDREGISPTEREFDKATELRRDRLVFVRKVAAKRKAKEIVFLEKVGRDVTWRQFTTLADLKACVYDSLVTWLQENGLVTNKPFDKSCSFHAESADVDAEKFVDDKGPSQKGLVKGPSQKGLVKGPSQKGSAKGPGQMLLIIRGHSEISISGIADAYGKKSASGSMKRCLLALIEDGLVSPTRPQKRGSRLQTYRITAKGIKFLQQRLKSCSR